MKKKQSGNAHKKKKVGREPVVRTFPCICNWFLSAILIVNCNETYLQEESFDSISDDDEDRQASKTQLQSRKYLLQEEVRRLKKELMTYRTMESLVKGTYSKSYLCIPVVWNVKEFLARRRQLL
jgi:uncharacterized protein YlxW (UPF0749 family)